MITLRIESIFENMIQIFFNDNCMNNIALHDTCKQLWDDLKVLDYFGLETPGIIKENQDKYIDDEFTEHEFNRIYKVLKYLLDRFRDYMDERESVQLVLLGRIFNYLETKTAAYRSDDHVSIVSNPHEEGIDQEKFGLLFRDKLIEEFRDPNNPLVDPNSSIEDQVREVAESSENKIGFWGSLFLPSARKARKVIDPVEEKREMAKKVKAEKIEIEKTKDLYHVEGDSLKIARKMHEERVDS